MMSNNTFPCSPLCKLTKSMNFNTERFPSWHSYLWKKSSCYFAALSVGLCQELSVFISLMFRGNGIIFPMSEKCLVNRIYIQRILIMAAWIFFYSNLKMSNKILSIELIFKLAQKLAVSFLWILRQVKINYPEIAHMIHLELNPDCRNSQLFFCLKLKVGMWSNQSSLTKNYQQLTDSVLLFPM